MPMWIEKRYREILQTLEKGHRYQASLCSQEVEELSRHLANTTPHTLQALCILQHTKDFFPKITPEVIEFLSLSLGSSELVIHGLAVARKHIIAAYQREGKRLPPDFLLVMQKLLSYSDWEVKEWVVRTIDECGSQAAFFSNDLKRIYPSRLAILTNQHKRYVRGIIDIIYSRWSHPNHE